MERALGDYLLIDQIAAINKEHGPGNYMSKKKKKVKKARNWGIIVLQFKVGKGPHSTKKGKKGYKRKSKHKDKHD